MKKCKQNEMAKLLKAPKQTNIRGGRKTPLL